MSLAGAGDQQNWAESIANTIEFLLRGETLDVVREALRIAGARCGLSITVEETSLGDSLERIREQAQAMPPIMPL